MAPAVHVSTIQVRSTATDGRDLGCCATARESMADRCSVEQITMNDEKPDEATYFATSRRLKVSFRCPHASVERCPRYYQSVSLLGKAGFTGIDPEEDERLLRKWKRSDIWPRTSEELTGVMGPVGHPKYFSNFCPEVSFDRFGLFATYLGSYADEIDSNLAHERLGRIKAPLSDWRWRWSSVVAQHYTACPFFSVIESSHDARLSGRKARQTDNETSAISQIFLSHAAIDARLAILLGSEINKRRPDLKVFVASQPGDIPAGEKWLDAIESQLDKGDLYIALLTRHSVSRPWLWFEAGSAWLSGKRIWPVTGPGFAKGDIPLPLSARQALSLDTAADIRQLFIQLDSPISLAEADELVVEFRAMITPGSAPNSSGSP